MIIKKLSISISLIILMTNVPVYSQVESSPGVQKISQSYSSQKSNTKSINMIDWSDLSLSEDQMKKIDQLNQAWKQIESMIRPKIVRDQQRLKNVMSNPNIAEDEIRNLQRDIMLRQEQLRYEATENFLSKRRILSTDQRKKLHKMMSE